MGWISFASDSNELIHDTNMSTVEVKIAVFKALQKEVKDTKPYWFRISDSGKLATTYNRAGCNMKTNVPLSECKNLTKLATHRQFVHSESDKLKKLDKIAADICRTMGWKVFQNGKLYVKTRRQFADLLINS